MPSLVGVMRVTMARRDMSWHDMVLPMTSKQQTVAELVAGPLDQRLNTPVNLEMKRNVLAIAAVKGWREADVVRAAVAAYIKEAQRKR